MSVPTFFVFKVGRLFSSPPAESVEVAGSFNNWIKVKMNKVFAYFWTLTLELPPGQYQYKFFVDNKWIHNEEKPTTQDNIGGLNNVITVEEKGDLKAALKSALEADYEKLKEMGQLKKLKLPFDVSDELLASKIENDINGALNCKLDEVLHTDGRDYIPQEGYRNLLGASAAFGWEEVCKLLISAGADVNLNEIPGGGRHVTSPLYLAAHFGWPNICQILLSAGIGLNTDDAMQAAEYENRKLCNSNQIIDMFKKYESSRENEYQVPEARQVSMALILSAPWNRISVPTRFVFTNKPNGTSATHVELAGSFTNWVKVKMCDDSDEWTITLKLPPGQYEYKFFVDNKWIHDKEKPTTPDNFGGLNNVITVEEKGDMKLKVALKDALEEDYEKLNKIGKLNELVNEEKLPFDVAYELLASKLENDINGPLRETPEDSMKSPLYCAAEFGWPSVCKILLSAGPAISIKDPWNWSEYDTSKYDVLDIAKKKNHTQVIDILEEHISSLPPWTLEQVLKDFGITLSEINKEIEIYSKPPWNKITALSYYAAIGKKDACQALIEGGADVNKMNADGSTTLSMAIHQSAQNDICKMLIEAGADVDKENMLRGETPLLKAIKKIPEPGYIEIVKTLLLGGADAVRRRDYNGKTGLFYAVSEGHTEIVKAILEKEKDLSEAHCEAEDGWTPIMEAIHKGYTEICKLLIEGGAELDKQNGEGKTALMIAAKNEKPEFCKMLLSAGADISKRDRDHYGKTALDIAKAKDPSTMTKNNLDVIDVFEKHGVPVTPLQLDQVLMREGVHEDNIDKLYEDGITALMFSIQIGNEDDCKFLIKSGANINWTNGSTLRPLATAVAYDRQNICKFLIEAGADINSTDVEGKTPLIHSVLHNRQNICKMLIEAGAEFNSRDGEDKTPLIDSVFYDRQNICKMLIEAGADVNSRDGEGKTPLIHAILHDRQNIYKMLIDAGAHVELTDIQDKDLLWEAAHRGREDIFKMLLKAGANKETHYPGLLYEAIKNKNIKITEIILSADLNFDIWDPLYLATKDGHVDILKIIIEKRPDIDFDDIGNQLLMIATNNGHLEICKLLIEVRADPLDDDGIEIYGAPLVHAAQNGHTDIVKMFLEQIPNNMNVDNGKQKAPLMSTEEERHGKICKTLVDSLKNALRYTEIFELLIEAGAIALQKHNHYKVRAALLRAAQEGLTDIVKMIIEKGPNMDINDYEYETPLMDAIENGSMEILKLLVKAGADVDKQTDWYDVDTPLIRAVKNGEVKICKLLVEAGADLNKQNKFGYTALIMATIEEHIEICDILLTAGADANIMCDYEKMGHLYNHDKKFKACDIAMYYHFDEVVGIFKKHGETSNMDIRKQLWFAATNGRIDIIKMIREKRPDVDVDDFLYTPLMSATSNGHVEACKLLIEAGADPLKHHFDDDLMFEGHPPLHDAARSGHVDIVKIFLGKLTNMNVDNAAERQAEISKELINAVDLAICNGHTEISKLLIEGGAFTSKNPDNKDVQEALYNAADKGLIDIVKIILEKVPYIDVNGADPLQHDGKTALMAAVDNVEIMKLLVEGGADLDKQNDCGHTALMMAARDGHIDSVKLILEKRPDVFRWAALMEATKYEYTEICKLLIDTGADPFKDEEYYHRYENRRYSPLKLAAEMRRTDIVKMFLEKLPKNVNEDNDKQKTSHMAVTDERQAETSKSLLDSLDVAADNGNSELCKLLIEAGALKNGDVRQALVSAVYNGLMDVVKMIIEKAPNLDVNDYDASTPRIDFEGRSPLMLAIARQNVDILKLLVEAGANLEKQTAYSSRATPLIYAVKYETVEICKLLVEAGVDLDENDYTALMFAAKKGLVEICKLLVEAGADLDKQKKDGYTALMMAARDGLSNICDILLTAGADPDKTCVIQERKYIFNIEVLDVFEKHGVDATIDISDYK